MRYQCRHFDIHELVPPTIYESRGGLAWELFDRRILESIDQIRDDFGPILVNNWKSGGPLRYRGFRPHDATIGARLSQHRYGRAIDFTPLQAGLDEVYDTIKTGKYPGITTVENIDATRGGNWIHIDCRNTEPVRVVNP